MTLATFPAFKSITIGATTVTANETGSTLTFVEGSNITLALDPLTDTITISSPSGGGGSSLALTPDNSSNATNYVIFNSAATGDLLPRTDTDFYYNPSTGILAVTGIRFGDATTQTTASSGGSFSGSYNDLTDKPIIPAEFSFKIAGDDSTQRTILNSETIKFIGSGGITITTDTEGAVTITGSGGSPFANDITVNGLNYGRGAGNVSTNTSAGSGALVVNTTGGQNTAVGYRSLYSNIGGAINTALGSQSLYSNTSGNFNTAIGFNSLYNNIGGEYNVALGAISLRDNTDGLYNIAIGYNSALKNTTGSANVAIGWQALAENLTSQNNVAIGRQSCLLTTADSNTAVGSFALQDNTSGRVNTGIGYSGLENNTTGSGNIAIGPCAIIGGNLSYVPVFDPTTENNRICMGSTAATNAYVQVAWTVVSDIRDKTAISNVPHGLDFVTKIEPISYQYKISRDSNEGHGPIRYGFSAQQVLELEGENSVIVDSEDSNKLRFNDQSMMAVLVNAIKDLNSKIEEQALEIKILKEKGH